MRSWYAANDLAGLPGMPATQSGVIRAAKRGGWASRKRQGRGGGREYAASSLPAPTQAALLSGQASTLEDDALRDLTGQFITVQVGRLGLFMAAWRILSALLRGARHA